jgi:predicted dehydrogenase
VLRAAIIGCGGIGSQLHFDPGSDRIGVCTHAAAYDKNLNIELVALCDQDDENLSRSAKEWSVKKVYNDWEEMLKKEDLDIISICTPTSTHYDIAIACLLSKNIKGILLEKPVADTVGQSEELEALFKDSKVKVLVNYGRRFSPEIKSLHNSIKSKEFGDPVLITGMYTKGLIHNGSHWVDLLRYFFGQPDWIRAENRINDNSSDPGLDVVFGFNSGLDANLFAFSSNLYTVFEMNIFFSRGHIRIIEDMETILIHKVLDDYPFVGYQSLSPATIKTGCRDNWMSYVVENLVSSIFEDKEPLCTIHDGVCAHKITNFVRQSYIHGSTEKIFLE